MSIALITPPFHKFPYLKTKLICVDSLNNHAPFQLFSNLKTESVRVDSSHNHDPFELYLKTKGGRIEKFECPHPLP